MSSERPIRRALLSVSDKTGLIEFARALAGEPDVHAATAVAVAPTLEARSQLSLSVRAKRTPTV